MSTGIRRSFNPSYLGPQGPGHMTSPGPCYTPQDVHHGLQQQQQQLSGWPQQAANHHPFYRPPVGLPMGMRGESLSMLPGAEGMGVGSGGGGNGGLYYGPVGTPSGARLISHPGRQVAGRAGMYLSRQQQHGPYMEQQLHGGPGLHMMVEGGRLPPSYHPPGII